MAEGGDDAGRRGEPENAPGSVFVPFMMMEDLLEKLKLLNYEADFCVPNGLRSFARHHFALPGDSGQQFYQFAALVTWLLSLLGRHMEQVQVRSRTNSGWYLGLGR